MIKRVLFYNLGMFEEKVKSLIRKAKRLKLAEIPEYVILGFEEVKGELYVNVEVNNVKVVLPNASFLASIEHYPAGNLILSDVDGFEEYRNVPARCDHCNTKRTRNKSYLVESGGSVFQVGGNCLADFVGSKNAEYYADLYKCLIILNKMETERLGFIKTDYIDLVDVLSVSEYFIKKQGYVPSSLMLVQSTRDLVWRYLNYSNKEWREIFKEEKPEIPESCSEKPSKVLEFMSGFEPKGNFQTNLKVISDSRVIKSNQLGLAVFLVEFYNREVLKIEAKRVELEKKAKVKSQFVGVVGEKSTFKGTFEKCIYLGDHRFGSSYLIKFRDLDGNLFVWKTSKCAEDIFGGEYEDNQKVEVTGKIKNHQEYNSENQTVISHCKVVKKIS